MRLLRWFAANTYYFLSDGLGSTMKTVDATGTVVNGYTYDVYGKKTSSTGSQANEFDFAGQQTDATGLQYLRARYYDPVTGTFLSRDPMSASPGWGGNSYAYASGNPVDRTDPTGRVPLDGGEDGGAATPYWDSSVQYWRDPISNLVWTETGGWHDYRPIAPATHSLSAPTAPEPEYTYVPDNLGTMINVLDGLAIATQDGMTALGCLSGAKSGLGLAGVAAGCASGYTAGYAVAKIFSVPATALSIYLVFEDCASFGPSSDCVSGVGKVFVKSAFRLAEPHTVLVFDRVWDWAWGP